MRRIVEIPVKDKSILIDAEVLPRVRQHILYITTRRGGRTWYPFIKRKGRVITLGRFILNANEDQIVDHIDGNVLNNCRSNLRFVTTQQNNWNKNGAGSSTSRCKGVSWNTKRRKWIAVISVNSKTEYLGSFNSETKAARAYEKRAREIHGRFFRKSRSQILRTDEPTEWIIYIQRGRKSSKLRGIRWRKRDKVWEASIKVNGQKIEIGRFHSEREAAQAYDEAAKKYHGPKAILNFPPNFLIKRMLVSA